jgi:hypothetical protein
MDGSFGVGVTEPIFLGVGSKTGRPYAKQHDSTRMVSVLNHADAMKEMLREAGPSWSLFELVSGAQALHRALLKTTPSKRGRFARR